VFGFMLMSREQEPKTRPGASGRAQLSSLFASGLIFAAAIAAVQGQAPRISLTAENSQGNIVVTHTADTNNYYLLLRGPRVTLITTAVDAALGVGPSGQLRDTKPPAGGAFYRVEAVPKDTPLDSDGDGIDDVYELEHAPALNPLNPNDAATLAPNGSGLT
jgi:hypothetical protein